MSGLPVLSRISAAAALALTLAGCSMSDGSLEFERDARAAGGLPPPTSALSPAAGESIGSGPVRVALLLPLSGDAALAAVGVSIANGARLAMAMIAEKPDMADNITIVLKDSGVTSASAAQAATQAVSEGSALILGPLRADQVSAAGAVARAAGITLIGFSNNSAVAAPGIFLLNVLPESEMRRSLGFARTLGKTRIAGIFPTTDFGRLHATAFRQQAAGLGLTPAAEFSFASEDEARTAAAQIAQLVRDGAIDALVMPDRSTASSLATMLDQAGLAAGTVTVFGSADWDGDTAIAATPWLAGAYYPAVDTAGYEALLPGYQSRFGGRPHPLATVGYTAAILANVTLLSMGTPRYDRGQLTAPAGFNGRDGLFRFTPDGKGDYALTIKQLRGGTAVVVDAARL